MTRWQHNRLRGLARQMIALEHSAQQLEQAGNQERADVFWQRRETVQWMRSLLLRDSWTHDQAERVRQ
jgi:hypothetical protein